MVPFKPERSASQSGDETAGGAFPLQLRSGRGNGRASKSGRGQRKRESASERYKEDGGSFKSTGTAQQLHPPLPLVFCSTAPPSSPLSSRSLLSADTGIYHQADTRFHTCFLFTACGCGQLCENGAPREIERNWGPRRARRGVCLQLCEDACASLF